ncbi:MAG TPA: hypothetical protein VFQ38_17480 [Longimicrobiales bacterium]|nr:hypothetical protein [Longimicrobiales bacterium]
MRIAPSSPLALTAVALLALPACGRDGAGPATREAAAYTAIVAGRDRSCAVSATGTAYCWGRRGAGAPDDSAAPPSLVPTAVAGVPAARAVTLGEQHSCVLGVDGRAFCWGENDHAELGDGSTTRRAAPTPVGGDRAFAALAAGAHHTCGLEPDGRASCWGWDLYGQLGVGATVDLGIPERLPGRRFAALAAGGDHTCAVTADGAAYCWGRNDRGQLGSDSAAARCGPAGVACSLVPVRVRAAVAFAAITAGGDHTCALSTQGAAYCWGAGDLGQLGAGTLADAREPVAVAAPVAFTAISAGADHTCAVTADHQAYCWGDATYGRLGNGAGGAVVATPARVAGGLALAAVSAGTLHTCALAADGAAYCWGFAGFGQLGSGSTLASTVPVRVAPPGPASGASR